MSLGTQMEWFQLLFLLPNFVSNHLAICLLFYYIGGAIAFVPLVGLGVDEITLDCELLLVLLIRKLLSWLRTLVGLVAFLWHFEQVTVCRCLPPSLLRDTLSSRVCR